MTKQANLPPARRSDKVARIFLESDGGIFRVELFKITNIQPSEISGKSAEIPPVDSFFTYTPKEFLDRIANHIGTHGGGS